MLLIWSCCGKESSFVWLPLRAYCWELFAPATTLWLSLTDSYPRNAATWTKIKQQLNKWYHIAAFFKKSTRVSLEGLRNNEYPVFYICACVWEAAITGNCCLFNAWLVSQTMPHILALQFLSQSWFAVASAIVSSTESFLPSLSMSQWWLANPQIHSYCTGQPLRKNKEKKKTQKRSFSSAASSQK